MMVILSSNNENKVLETKKLMKDEFDIDIVSLTDIDEHIDPDERYDNYGDNAVVKIDTLIHVSPAYSHHIIIADDSGLEIDALKGFPGVKSNRFANEDHPEWGIKERIDHILAKMSKVTHNNRRSAKYISKVAVYIPGNKIQIFTGTLDGFIPKEPMNGGTGFGYDPIMYLPEYNKSCDQLDWDTKKIISHRCIALRKAGLYIKMKMEE